MGRHAALNLRNSLSGKPTKPFRYRDYGHSCRRCMGVIDARGGPLPANIEALFPDPVAQTRVFGIIDTVVQALRAWLESDPAAQSGWLGALQDPQIGRAITLIHCEPGRPWTVASPVTSSHSSTWEGPRRPNRLK